MSFLLKQFILSFHRRWKQTIHFLVFDLIWTTIQVVSVLAVRMQGELTNPVPALLHSAPFSRAKHRPAESTHERSTEALRSRQLPPPPADIASVLQCVGTVKGKLGWSVGQAGRAQDSSLPTGAPDQHAQIRGNLFHNIAASCFPRLGPHRRQRQRFGRWPSLFVGLLVHATCAELDSPLILLAL